jgi:hypothetical protein
MGAASLLSSRLVAGVLCVFAIFSFFCAGFEIANRALSKQQLGTDDYRQNFELQNMVWVISATD